MAELTRLVRRPSRTTGGAADPVERSEAAELLAYERMPGEYARELTERLAALAATDPSLLRRLEELRFTVLRDHAGTRTNALGAALVTPIASGDGHVLHGREQELARLRDWLDPGSGTGPHTIAVAGRQGIGKTTLACHMCSELKGRFSGGAFRVDLNGHAEDPRARRSAEHFYGPLLIHLGVNDWRDESDQNTARACALYQRTMAELAAQGRSVVLLLDNVRHYEQIEGLLPENPAHRVLIICEDPHDLEARVPRLRTLQVPALAADSAVAMMHDVVAERHPGSDLIPGNPHEALQLAELCHRRPYALNRVALELASEPDTRWMKELIDRLQAAPLAVLHDAAGRAFGMSLSLLRERDERAARLLLLLSVNPGPHFSAQAAAAITGEPEPDVLAALTTLCRMRLLDHHYDDGRRSMPDLARRWSMQDLDRQCVDQVAAKELPAGDRRAAFGRLMRHYDRRATEVADSAGWFLLRHTTPLSRPYETASSRSLPVRAASLDAQEWFETEWVNLEPCRRRAVDEYEAHLPRPGSRRVRRRGRIGGAGRAGRHGHEDCDGCDLGARVVGLTAATAGHLRNNGPWVLAEQAHRRAAEIARDLGDRRAEGTALNNLGITYRLLGNRDAADPVLRRAQRIFRDLRALDPRRSRHRRARWLGQANALHERGVVANDNGWAGDAATQHRKAAGLLKKAWELYRRAGDPIGAPNAAKNLGVAHYRLSTLLDAAGKALHAENHRAKATSWLRDALNGYDEIGDLLGEVEVRNHLGRIQLDRGDVEAASRTFRRVLDLMHDPRNQLRCLLEESRANEGLGRCHAQHGDTVTAAAFLREAETGYAEIGAEDACRRVATALTGLRRQAEL